MTAMLLLVASMTCGNDDSPATFSPHQTGLYLAPEKSIRLLRKGMTRVEVERILEEKPEWTFIDGDNKGNVGRNGAWRQLVSHYKATNIYVGYRDEVVIGFSKASK